MDKQQLQEEAMELLRAGDDIAEGSDVQALRMYEKSQSIFEELYGRNHINSLIILNRIALVHDSQGKFGERNTFPQLFRLIFMF